MYLIIHLHCVLIFNLIILYWKLKKKQQHEIAKLKQYKI